MPHVFFLSFIPSLQSEIIRWRREKTSVNNMQIIVKQPGVLSTAYNF